MVVDDKRDQFINHRSLVQFTHKIVEHISLSIMINNGYTVATNIIDR